MNAIDPIRTRFVDVPANDWPQRARALGLVALVHVFLAFLVLRGLGGVTAVLREAGLGPTIEAHDVPLEKPSPTPTKPVEHQRDEGAEGVAGKKAKATQIVAAPARIIVPAAAAAPAASTGNQTVSGAAASGAGTGGGASGTGTGTGGHGNGAGGRYLAQKAVKTAGDITSERDYPKATRALRLGTSVTVALTVGTDGRVTDCRIHKASGDPQADAITCKLATERFRFRPATDQTGSPMESTYGWQQRFFAPDAASANE